MMVARRALFRTGGGGEGPASVPRTDADALRFEPSDGLVVQQQLPVLHGP